MIDFEDIAKAVAYRGNSLKGLATDLAVALMAVSFLCVTAVEHAVFWPSARAGLSRACPKTYQQDESFSTSGLSPTIERTFSGDCHIARRMADEPLFTVVLTTTDETSGWQWACALANGELAQAQYSATNNPPRAPPFVVAA